MLRLGTLSQLFLEPHLENFNDDYIFSLNGLSGCLYTFVWNWNTFLAGIKFQIFQELETGNQRLTISCKNTGKIRKDKLLGCLNCFKEKFKVKK